MAFESNFVTLIGNLTDDPVLRYTGNGVAVTNFRIAVNRKWTDRDNNQQEETTFVAVNLWRDAAENVAESLHRGDRAIVIGRLKIRSYDDKEGQTRWVTEIEADEVAPSLRWARAEVSKVNRVQAGVGGQGGGQQQQQQQQGGGQSQTGGNGYGRGRYDDGVPPPPDMDDVPF